MRQLKLIIAALVLITPFAANADPILGIFGTGLDEFGNPSAGVDANYTVNENGDAPAVLTRVAGTYFPNDANSQWIWQNSNGLPINTTLTFRTTFDLTGFDSSTAIINGAWGTDNQGIDILINGVSTGINLLGVKVENFNQLHAWQISSGFVSGINTLEFVIEDNGVIGAFRTELSGTADPVEVPEPASLALLGIGLLGMGMARRRKTV